MLISAALFIFFVCTFEFSISSEMAKESLSVNKISMDLPVHTGESCMRASVLRVDTNPRLRTDIL